MESSRTEPAPHVSLAVRLRGLTERERTVGLGATSFRVSNGALLVSEPESRFSEQAPAAKATSIPNEFLFDENSTNEQVYVACVRPLVQNFLLNGENSCCFAYGQIGSGKTLQMFGDIDSFGVRTKGIFSLALEDVLSVVEASDGSCALRARFVEIMGDSLVDLLDLDAQPSKPSKISDLKESQLPEFEVNSSDDIENVILMGNARRASGPFGIHKQSSRSHAILQLIFDRVVDTDGTRMVSKLFLVDLCGSDSFASTKQAALPQEVSQINKSLLALGNCINLLGDRKSSSKPAFIPWRDSRLTSFLRDGMETSKKILIIANISPSASCYTETKNTLSFVRRSKAPPASSRLVAPTRLTTQQPSQIVSEQDPQFSDVQSHESSLGAEDMAPPAQRMLSDAPQNAVLIPSFLRELAAEDGATESQPSSRQPSTPSLYGGRSQSPSASVRQKSASSTGRQSPSATRPRPIPIDPESLDLSTGSEKGNQSPIGYQTYMDKIRQTNTSTSATPTPKKTPEPSRSSSAGISRVPQDSRAKSPGVIDRRLKSTGSPSKWLGEVLAKSETNEQAIQKLVSQGMIVKPVQEFLLARKRECEELKEKMEIMKIAHQEECNESAKEIHTMMQATQRVKEQCQKEVEDKNAELESTKDVLQKTCQQLSDITDEADALKEQVASLSTQLANTQQNLAEKEEELNIATAEFEKNLKESEQRLKELRESSEEAMSSYKDLWNRGNATLETQVTRLESIAETRARDLESLTAEHAKKLTELSQLKSESSSRISELEQECLSTKNDMQRAVQEFEASRAEFAQTIANREEQILSLSDNFNVELENLLSALQSAQTPEISTSTPPTSASSTSDHPDIADELALVRTKFSNLREQVVMLASARDAHRQEGLDRAKDIENAQQTIAKLEEECASLKGHIETLTLEHSEYKETKQTEISQLVESFDTSVLQKEKEIDSLKTRLDELSQTSSATVHELRETLEKEREENAKDVEKIAQLEQFIKVKNDYRTQLEQKVKTLEASITEHSTDKDKVETYLEQIMKEAETAEQERERLEGELATQSAQLEVSRSALDSARAEHRAEIAELRSELSGMQDRLDEERRSAEAEESALRKQIESLKKESEEKGEMLAEERKKREDENAQLTEKIASLEQFLKVKDDYRLELDQKVRSLQDSILSQTAECQKLETYLQEVTQECEKLDLEKTKLGEELEKERREREEERAQNEQFMKVKNEHRVQLEQKLKSLEEEKSKVDSYLQQTLLDAENLDKEKEQLSNELELLRTEKESLNSHIQEKEKECLGRMEEIERLSNELESERRRNEELVAKLEKELGQQREEMTLNLEQKQGEWAESERKMNESLEEVGREKENLIGEIQKLQEVVSALERDLSESESRRSEEREQGEEKVGQLTEELERERVKLAEVQIEAERLRESLAKEKENASKWLEVEKRGHKKSIADLQSLQVEHSALQSELDHLRDQNESEISKLNSSLEEKGNQLLAVQADLIAKTKEFNAMKGELDRKVVDLENQLQKVSDELEQTTDSGQLALDRLKQSFEVQVREYEALIAQLKSDHELHIQSRDMEMQRLREASQQAEERRKTEIQQNTVLMEAKEKLMAKVRTSLEEQLKRREEEIKEMNVTRERILKENQASWKGIQESFERQIRELNAELQQARTSNAEKDSALATLRVTLEHEIALKDIDIREKQGALDRAAQDKQFAVDTVMGEVGDLKDALQRLASEKDREIQKHVQALQNATQKHDSEILEIRKANAGQIAELQTRLSEQRTAFDKAEKERGLAQQSVAALERRVAELQKQSQTVEALSAELSNLREENERKSSEFQQQLDGLTQTNAQLENDLKTAKANLSEKDAALKKTAAALYNTETEFKAYKEASKKLLEDRVHDLQRLKDSISKSPSNGKTI